MVGGGVREGIEGRFGSKVVGSGGSAIPVGMLLGKVGNGGNLGRDG